MSLTIEEYLVGQFEYEFSELNIATALESWGIAAGTPHTNVGQREKDLALSNLFMVLANVTSGGGKRVTKGNRTVTNKSYSFGITDRKNFRDEALRLRRKWGIEDTSITGGAESGTAGENQKQDQGRDLNGDVSFGYMFGQW